MEETERQLEELQVKLEATLLDMTALIFTAQILMLKDKGFHGFDFFFDQRRRQSASSHRRGGA